ncbi:hypothetical protein [Calycomorphotria hydatis]|uniref:Uncharacterized protein n=1 Tax=Calycomorphotria hydatis TaxID=2528027 RepID=A0A517TEM7_9PLAN|nr:hypothetical protein [Calycomorphotria hydatis]QDT66827.1 hypothetical protein V22_40990 [Calycomorphotria hydatis]
MDEKPVLAFFLLSHIAFLLSGVCLLFNRLWSIVAGFILGLTAVCSFVIYDNWIPPEDNIRIDYFTYVPTLLITGLLVFIFFAKRLHQNTQDLPSE